MDNNQGREKRMFCEYRRHKTVTCSTDFTENKIKLIHWLEEHGLMIEVSGNYVSISTSCHRRKTKITSSYDHGQ